MSVDGVNSDEISLVTELAYVISILLKETHQEQIIHEILVPIKKGTSDETFVV